MKHIIILIGFVVLIQFNPVFAHTVTEFYGVGGCPVNSCGVTDWDLYQIASDSMFYVSLIVYSMVLVLFFYFLYKRKCTIRQTM